MALSADEIGRGIEDGERKLFIHRQSQPRRDLKSFKKTVQSMFGRETIYYYDTKRGENNKIGE